MTSGRVRTTMWNESIPDAAAGRLAGIERLSRSSGPSLGNVVQQRPPPSSACARRTSSAA